MIVLEKADAKIWAMTDILEMIDENLVEMIEENLAETTDFLEKKKESAIVTCADCGTECEVPFVPKTDRPVYCSDCFRQNKPEDSRDDRFSRNDRERVSRDDRRSRNDRDSQR